MRYVYPVSQQSEDPEPILDVQKITLRQKRVLEIAQGKAWQGVRLVDDYNPICSVCGPEIAERVFFARSSEYSGKKHDAKNEYDK